MTVSKSFKWQLHGRLPAYSFKALIPSSVFTSIEERGKVRRCERAVAGIGTAFLYK